MLTIKKIIKEVGNKHLTLDRIDNTYFVFYFDDGVKYDSETILVYRLNDLDLDRWVAEAHSFLERIGEL